MSELTLQQANEIIAACLSSARESSLPPVAVAVLDAGGHLKSLQREDGVSFLRVQICQAKAWGALGMATDSGDFEARYAQGAQQQGFVNALNAMTQGGIIPLPGGVLISGHDGRLLGAIGVAGAASDDDERCARRAIESVGLLHAGC